MNIRSAKLSDECQIAHLIAQFRVELKALKGIQSTPKVEQGKEEFIEYLNANYPIYVAEDDQLNLIGYLVCRIDQGVVWVESIFVNHHHRRSGIATQLFQTAERLASELGNENVYNWVHPNNDKIINFLAKMDYNVLNLIEIRKAYSDEKFTEKIRIRNHEYDY